MLNKLKIQLYILFFGLCFLIISKNCLSEEIIINKSKLDKKQYKFLVLPNQLRVLLISDKDAQKSAAALTVDVGSIHDPVGRDGMAHYLEHMLFLGTKSYPEPSEYFEFIKKHGGYANAMTAPEYTKYLFDIIPEHFDAALDRFSKFFIEPLFTEKYVDRERNAVDSEFNLSSKQDSRREYHMFKVTSNKKHPFHRFSVGNLTTLSNNKSRPIRPELISFYNDYYSSDRMYLTLVANLTIKQLEQLATEHFSAVPLKSTKSTKFTELPVSKDTLQTDLAIRALGETRQLSVLFPLESQIANYKNKAADFLAYLIDNKDSNSLYQELKSKNLITSMGTDTYDLFKNQSYFHVTFELTEKGEKNKDLITKYLFSYIKFIKEQHDANKLELIYNELKLAGERNFQYNHKDSPLNLASNTSTDLIRFPVEDIIRHNFIFENYDHAKIYAILNSLTIDNSRRIYNSKKAKTDQIEQIYNIDYKLSKYEAKILSASFYNFNDLNTNYSLPEANPLIPENFDMITDIKYLDKSPSKLITKSYYELWHKQDLRFNEPKTYIKIAIESNIASDSAHNRTLLNIFEQDLILNTNSLDTKFDLAGINFGIGKIDRGITISINSFSDKQDLILAKVINHINNITISETRLKLLKDLVRQNFNNFRQELPFRQAWATLESLVFTRQWHPLILLDEIEKITTNDYDLFIADFLSDAKYKILVQGNIVDKHAVEITKPLEQFVEKNISHAKFTGLSDINLTILKSSNTVFNFPSLHNDNAVINYFQVNANSKRQRALALLTASILSNPTFETLRTKEQLGYVVFATSYDFKDNSSLLLGVESPKYSSAHINERIAAFLQEYKLELMKFNQDKLNSFKNSLKANLTQKPKTLTEATNKNFKYISNDTHWFNDNDKVAGLVDKIKLEELIGFYDNVLLNSATKTKLEINAKNDDKSDFGVNWRNFKNQIVSKDI